MTFVQLPETGQYPTYWWKSELKQNVDGWINCAYYDIEVMMEMDDFTKNMN